MKFEFSLARRYLRSPGRGLAKFTSRLAIIGIAFGVAAMIFALALSRGFREEVQEKLLTHTPHIVANKADGSGIENIGQVKDALSNIGGITSVKAATYQNALLITAQMNTYTVLRGREEIQPERQDGCIAAVFGSELAKKTGLKVGDTADVIFDMNDDGSPQKICLFFKDTLYTGLYEYDSAWVNVSLNDLRAFREKPASLEIGVANIYASQTIAQTIAGKIKEKLGEEYKVLDWQEANRPFFAAMNFERRIVLIIISLVILLSALNITFTLALGVTQRRQDIAILRSSGAKTFNILLAFLFEGAWLGIAGIIPGTLLGWLACFLCNQFDLLSLPAEIYTINRIVLRPDPVEIFAVIAGAFLLTLISALYPAFLASQVKPWDNLRQ